MTLVAGVSVGSLPAFIGDLLLSWRIPSAVDLPTQIEDRVRPGIGKDFAAGLAQKVVIVRPYLMLAWAGAASEAKRIIQELDAVLPLEVLGSNDREIILGILNTCAENTEMVALVIWRKAIWPFGVHTRGFEIENTRVYLLGSGATSFFEYLQTHPNILPTQEHANGLVARAIMLRFAARAMVSQWIAGIGLGDSWGGGFEVAYPDETGFKKVGNILFRAWMIEEDGSYSTSGRSFFCRYYGENLHLSCFPEEKTYIVPSPITTSCEIPRFEKIHPEWTLDVFLIAKHRSFVEVARFHPTRPVTDFVQLKNGILVGWAMDKEYVERCVKAARSAGEMNDAQKLSKRDHFEMFNY